jgi:hypothetical protein
MDIIENVRFIPRKYWKNSYNITSNIDISYFVINSCFILLVEFFSISDHAPFCLIISHKAGDTMPKSKDQFKAVMAPALGINSNDPINLIKDAVWGDGNNVHFGPGYVEKVPGYKKYLNQAVARTPSAAYAVGAYVTPATANTHIYKAMTAGTCGASEPTWPTSSRTATVTMTIASPCVVSWTGHGMSVDDVVSFTTTGALPAGLSPGTQYFVISAGYGSNAFELSAASGGTAINTTGSQSGVHTASCSSKIDGGVTWMEVGVNQLNGVVMAIDNYYKFNGDSYLLFITTTKVYSYNETDNTAVDITGGTLNGVITNPVFTENAQNYFIFTNGVDPVKYWTGSGNIANLPGLTDCVPWNDGTAVTSVVAKTLLYFDEFLILGGTVENSLAFPQRLRWSTIGDVTKWKNTNQATQDLQAGWADMTDGVDWIQALETIGNYIVAYKERSIQVVTYVGGDEIFDKWPAIEGTGLLAPKAILDLGDEHIFVGPDNIYSFDTREVKVAGDDIAKQFFDILDPSNTVLINCFWHEETPEGGFSFVSTSSPGGFPDKAVVYNTDTKAWSWRDLPMMCFGYYNLVNNPIWDNQEETWDSADFGWSSSTVLANAPINLCGDSQGFIYWFNGNSQDGADISCFIQTKLFDFGNPVLMKRAIRLQLMISREGSYNLPVWVGTASNVDEPVTWYGPYNMSLDKTSPPWVDFDITARYMAFKFGTQLKDQPWKLTGYIIYYQTRGPV